MHIEFSDDLTLQLTFFIMTGSWCNMKNEKEEIPQYIIDGIARMLLPEIQKFYESDEGKAEFEKWKAEKDEE